MPLADIHSHTLFGVDDGARSLEESLRMLEISYAEGVRLICLTPHCNPDLFPTSTREAAEENFAVLAAAAREKFPDLTLLLGNELYAFGSSVDALREGLCRPLGCGNVVLVEFASEVPFSELENTLHAIRSLGYRPLIAHAERYRCLTAVPARVEELVSRRVLIQVNAASVTASLFSPVGRFVRGLLKKGLVHAVASDGHREVGRSPHLADAYRKTASLCGQSVADALFDKNPRQFVSPKV